MSWVQTLQSHLPTCGKFSCHPNLVINKLMILTRSAPPNVAERVRSLCISSAYYSVFRFGFSDSWFLCPTTRSCASCAHKWVQPTANDDEDLANEGGEEAMMGLDSFARRVTQHEPLLPTWFPFRSSVSSCFISEAAHTHTHYAIGGRSTNGSISHSFSDGAKRASKTAIGFSA